MKISKLTSFAALSVTVLLLAACGTMGGDDGGIYGGSNDPVYNSNTLRGTVDYVDTGNRSIVLTNVSGYNASMLSNSGSGNSVRVYFDTQTPVEYQGRSYRAEDLERGDEVEIRVSESGSRLMADRVMVVRDASTGSVGSGSSSPYISVLTGSVRSVDNGRQTIELQRFNGGTVVVEYDNRTPVAFQGREYRPSDLERGDEVEIRASDLGNNRWLAETVTVTRSVSGGTSGGGLGSGTIDNSRMATIRGTVRSIDTYSRTIELDQTSWISGFNTGATGTGRIVVQYGSNANINVNGQMLPVTGLERGDVIEVDVDRSGSTYFANRIMLIRDVRR